MAITAIVGLPGHGKSYTAVDIAILQALREKRRIFTNIPLKMENLLRDFPEAQITEVELNAENNANPEFWLFEPGALICLDELWEVWPSGMKANNIPVHQLEFVKKHRHRTDETGRWQDIVFVTQNLSDIAVAIRDMVETTVMCRQLEDLGATDWFIREYYKGAIKGVEPGPPGKLINNERIQYKVQVYQYYVSNTQGQNKSIGPQGAKGHPITHKCW
jgi:zona occludens toxin